jgi:NADH-quinone oxidoreductase subunit J
MNVELFVFSVFAIAALVGAVTLVSARNPVYSAMGLLLTMVSMAVFYVLNNAHFVAAVQVIIYAGAVMTLFLFVIMLIGVDKEESREEQIPFQRPLVAVLAGGLILLVIFAARTAWVVRTAASVQQGTIENISDELFGTWMLPFQATILLLTIAAVGSVALARYEGAFRTAEGSSSALRNSGQDLARDSSWATPNSAAGDAEGSSSALRNSGEGEAAAAEPQQIGAIPEEEASETGVDE